MTDNECNSLTGCEAEASQSDELKPYGYLDGNYQNKCVRCEGMFIGAKRSMRCEGCALRCKDEETRHTPSETQGDAVEALRRFNNIIQNADHDANGVNIGNIRPAYLRHCDIQEIRTALQQQEALQRFKDYVHKRLDDAGIPTHPDGEHSKHGCRIGDRLDIALQQQNVDVPSLEKELAEETAQMWEQGKDYPKIDVAALLKEYIPADHEDAKDPWLTENEVKAYNLAVSDIAQNYTITKRGDDA